MIEQNKGWIRINVGFYLSVLSNSLWLRLVVYVCMFTQDSNYDTAENIVNVMTRMFIFYAEFKSCKHTTLTKVFLLFLCINLDLGRCCCTLLTTQDLSAEP